MSQINRFGLAAALAVCLVAFTSSAALADALTFTIDSTVSYVTLNIPNFSFSGNTINLTAQNRTNGAPLGTAWSANTNTGNTAFVSGTMATTIGGSLSGQTLSAIQFISGANSMVAINSGNYRPNPAAYNTLTSAYNNNSAAPGAYGATVHVALGNAGLVSFDNVTYDIGSNSAVPGSNGVGSGTFTTNDGLNPVNTGIAGSVFSVQGLPLFLVGQVLPNGSGSLGGLSTGDTANPGLYVFTSPTNLRITIPIAIPINIDLGGGVFLNATAAGRIIANAPVPEPSTFALAGLGFVSVVALVRRRRNVRNA